MVGIDGDDKLRNYSMIIDFIGCPYVKDFNPQTKSLTQKKCGIYVLFAPWGPCPGKYAWDSGFRRTMHEISGWEIINNDKILLQCVDKYPRFV